MGNQAGGIASAAGESALGTAVSKATGRDRSIAESAIRGGIAASGPAGRAAMIYANVAEAATVADANRISAARDASLAAGNSPQQAEFDGAAASAFISPRELAAIARMPPKGK